MGAVEGLTRVVEVIERRLGISCSGARAGVVTDVIRRQMEAAGIGEPTVFAARVEGDAATRARLAESLRVPETYLLREPAQLRVLRDEVLPSLLAGRDDARPLQLWSAGCASGEEAYSLAIVLHDAGLAGGADILATDRSDTALEAAARAVYGPWSFRGLDEATHGRYFVPTPDGTGREVVAQLRRGITFRRHDLVTDPYPRDLDLVVCRNVLLYLTPEHGRAVVERFASALAPGGWLLLGSADPHHAAPGLLEQVRTPAGSLYRRRAGTPRATSPHVTVRRRAVADERPPVTPEHARERPVTRPAAPSGPAAPAPVSRPDAEQLPDTILEYERLLAERPLDAELQSSYATLLLEAGQPEPALRAATGAVFLSPELAVAHLALGRAHLAIGEPARASRAFGRARELLAARATDEPVVGSTITAGRLLAVAASWERRAAVWSS